ncbi:hypothetical protein [Cupriavidus sp. TMH.W2]|uniref:4'-phosphopantetheinyl transferase family protein n=1 Tax=Cupriavidus sp. TMH.W2 TaxID=3434465 RepID=UPI003D773E5E
MAVDTAAELSALSTLSTSKRVRAAAFRQPANRAPFPAARSALRALLGHCPGVPPDAVPLVANAFGKPALGGQDATALQFNVSDSGARTVQRECLQRGLIVELGGRHGATVRFLPPLVIGEAEIDLVAELFGEAVLAAQAQCR